MKHWLWIALFALMALAGCGILAPSAKVGTVAPATTAKPVLTSATVMVSTPTTCDIPSGWVAKMVAPGDTVERLAVCAGSPAAEVRAANCLPADSLIYAGQIVWLPPACTRLATTRTADSPKAPAPGNTVPRRGSGFTSGSSSSRPTGRRRHRVPVATDEALSYSTPYPTACRAARVPWWALLSSPAAEVCREES
jgi:LysM repeat protein